MWKNTVQPDRPQMTTWRMRIACWKPRATNTHTVCVTLIAFPLQQWLHERASMLCYTYIASLVNNKIWFVPPEVAEMNRIIWMCFKLSYLRENFKGCHTVSQVR